MDEEYGKHRDVDADLVEITSRLGEPDATYRTNVRSVAWRLTVGVLLVVVAAGAHYAIWSGEIPWPRGAHLWKLLIVVLIGGPAYGLYLIYFAVRGMKLCVLEYPSGLFIWHRGQVLAFPWDEVRAIQIRGLPSKAALNHFSDTASYDLQKSGRRLSGTTVTLTRIDGEQVSLWSTLDGFADVGRRVQEETYRRLFPRMIEEIRSTGNLDFGPLTCNHLGVTVKNQILPWPEVADLVRAGDKLEIKRVGKKKKNWVKVEFHGILNPHVLMGIAEVMRS